MMVLTFLKVWKGQRNELKRLRDIWSEKSDVSFILAKILYFSWRKEQVKMKLENISRLGLDQ